VCERCPFFIHGCDFTSSEPPDQCSPCGGLILLSGLLREGTLLESEIVQADLLERAHDFCVSLTPRSAVKRLEENYIYHISRDELYEVNHEAAEMLVHCDGTRRVAELSPDPEFLRFCIQEDLLEFHQEPEPVSLVPGRSPVPSLRYLEWLVTFRCNLSCAHCYLGEPTGEEFPEDLIGPLLEEFSRMQGLRILVSGGEPTLYKHFLRLNTMVQDYPIRAVLLTNGMRLNEQLAAELNFHEVQISLDGMEQGHDTLRGRGTFRKAVAAMKAVRMAGIDLSVATMVHKGNLNEFDAMRELVTDMGAREWSIDYPCVKGRWDACPDLAVSPKEAAEKMAFAFGGSYHGTSPGWTCGRHLAAVLPSGDLCRCGLYQDRCYGSVREGLAKAWIQVEHIPIGETQCALCPKADVCGGGCRFRAGGLVERDEVMCRFHNITP